MRRDNILEKSIMLGMGGGTRKRARWLDDIKAVTKCTLAELCGSARDRDAWRKMIIHGNHQRRETWHHCLASDRHYLIFGHRVLRLVLIIG